MTHNDVAARSERKVSIGWFILIWGSFVVSFLLPAYLDRPTDKGPNAADASIVRGGEAFVQGLFAVILSIAGLFDTLVNRPAVDHDTTYWLELGAACWFANMAFLIGVAMLRKNRPRVAWVLGVVALFLGLSGLLLVQQEIGPVLVGYFSWLSSMGWLIACGSLMVATEKHASYRGNASERSDTEARIAVTS